ncbi:hypothetical protein [Stenotrophomonas maltophilia]|uniref:hypothetical protein n=1 Tax=Stenotrophomonas maltophilia TaxID=40324 RepID=UPI0015EC2BC6|nr:hypothetical protein [Stenotrophomonas maltophilia]
MVVALLHRGRFVSAGSLVVAVGDAAMLEAVQGESILLGDDAHADGLGDEALPGAGQRAAGDRLAAALDQQVTVAGTQRYWPHAALPVPDAGAPRDQLVPRFDHGWIPFDDVVPRALAPVGADAIVLPMCVGEGADLDAAQAHAVGQHQVRAGCDIRAANGSIRNNPQIFLTAARPRE